MTRTYRRWALGGLFALSGGIWALALLSFSGGNASAASALVGIPVGLIFAAVLVWAVTS